MPYSYATSVASGSSALVSIPFSFIDRAHVHVSLNGVQVDDGTLTWISNGQVQLASTPTAGTKIKAYRNTPASSPAVVFSAGNLDPADLNTAAVQALYLDQEVIDFLTACLGLNATATAFDGRGLEATHFADGAAADSLATVRQIGSALPAADNTTAIAGTSELTSIQPKNLRAVLVALGLVGPVGNFLSWRQVAAALADPTNPSGVNCIHTIMEALDPLLGNAATIQWHDRSPIQSGDSLDAFIQSTLSWSGGQMTAFRSLAASKTI